MFRNPTAHEAALESAADILFFGGAAGSLKTETMLVDAARESGNPNLRAIIFRQQFTQMTDIVDKTMRLYKLPARNNFLPKTSGLSTRVARISRGSTGSPDDPREQSQDEQR